MRVTCFVLLAVVILTSFPGFAQAQWTHVLDEQGGIVNSFCEFGDTLFAGTGAGIFLSTNGGAEWASNNPTLPNANLLRVGLQVLAGTETGCFGSTNFGVTWESRNLGLSNPIISSLGSYRSSTYAGTFRGGVFLSTDTAASWIPINDPLSENTNVQALLILDTHVFAGTYGLGIILTTNNGSTWSSTNTGLGDSEVLALSYSGGKIFAGTYGSGMFASTNNGMLWTRVAGVSTSYPIRAIAIDGMNIFAGTSGGGVLVSTDAGLTWGDFSSGLVNRRIQSLIVSNKYLFAGIDGPDSGGVWRYPLANITSSVPSAPRSPQQIQHAELAIHPNPAIDFMAIKWTGSAANSTLTLFNSLGESLMRYQIQSTGQSYLSVELLKSGIYFCTVFDGVTTTTRTVSILH